MVKGMTSVYEAIVLTCKSANTYEKAAKDCIGCSRKYKARPNKISKEKQNLKLTSISNVLLQQVHMNKIPLATRINLSKSKDILLLRHIQK